MDFNGVVMMSTVLDLGTISFSPGDDLPYILYLPSYAATAYYHKMLKDPPADLNAFLTEARHFAATTYAGRAAEGRVARRRRRRRRWPSRLAHFTGLERRLPREG